MKHNDISRTISQSSNLGDNFIEVMHFHYGIGHFNIDINFSPVLLTCSSASCSTIHGKHINIWLVVTAEKYHHGSMGQKADDVSETRTFCPWDKDDSHRVYFQGKCSKIYQQGVPSACTCYQRLFYHNITYWLMFGRSSYWWQGGILMRIYELFVRNMKVFSRKYAPAFFESEG